MEIIIEYKTKQHQVKVNNFDELQSKIQDLFKIKINQQRLLQGNKVITTLSNNQLIIVKNLGLQISWKLVFILEYLGPILIHSLFYLYSNHSILQTVALVMVVLHYLKREYETCFVHRFSNSTMPILNLPKNCFHYWVLGGLLISLDVYSSDYNLDINASNIVLLLLWLFSEMSNLKTHLILKQLRPEGSSIRKIPRGFGFDLVSCPNYFFEIIGWICFTIIVKSKFSLFFTLVGAVQMFFWAKKKHVRYLKEFKDYPKRKMLIPFII